MRATASGQQSAVFLTPEQLAARWEFAVKLKTMANWRAMGKGPRFIVVGGKPRYRMEDVTRWEQRQLGPDTLPRPRNMAGPGGGDVRTR